MSHCSVTGLRIILAKHSAKIMFKMLGVVSKLNTCGCSMRNGDREVCRE